MFRIHNFALAFLPATLTLAAVNTSHPRLWITTNDLPRLQSRAVTNNLIYQQGLLPQLQNSLNIYNTQFFPGGVANTNYPDVGDTQGYTGQLTESHALVLAFHSLINPNPTNRVLYAQYARNLLMHAMNIAVLGHTNGVPFRDSLFAVYNRANGQGEQWPLAVDWIYNATDLQGQPILSSADKLTIRNVFMLWANDCLNAYTTGGDHPAPIGVTNSLALLPGGLAYRMAANNYYIGHARLLTMMALSFDAVDDPPVNPALPSQALSNSLTSYLPDATGAWLYQEYAMFGDAASVKAAYNLPANASVGLASGGMPPEGWLYGHSFAYLLGQLLALQTAGYHDASLAGPQINLIGAPLWDRFINAWLSSITPTSQVFASESWLGPVYQMHSYGDLLRLYITPDEMQPMALLAVLDQNTGNLSRLNAERWFAVNAPEGGGAALVSRLQNPWSKTEPILYFLLLDPNAPAAIDPRPAMPTAFFDAPQGRFIARTGWTPNASVFAFRSSWISINHQQCDGGAIEFYRKGQWLTKPASNYDNNGNGQSSMWQNTLTLQNWCTNGTPALQWYETPLWLNGSQWMLGLDAGDPVTITSTGNNYAFTQTDMTKLYNRPGSIWTVGDNATDIKHASRSAFWLNGDYIVVYDRATSLHTNLFKRFNLDFTLTPTITSNLLSAVTTQGKFFAQSLLPANATMTIVPFGTNAVTQYAELEPTKCRVVIEDTTNPTDVRFLHVLQGADGNKSVDPATLVQSTSGTPFAGAGFAGNVVLFPVAITNPFTSVTYNLPAGLTNHYITGLASNAGYAVVLQAGQITVTPAGNFTTDGAGVLSFTATPYAIWKTTHSAAGDAADPDADGLPNLAEYALGTDPHVSNPGSVNPLHFTRNLAASDVTLAVEATSDLAGNSWSIIASNIDAAGWSTVPGVTVTDLGTGPVTVNESTNAPARFYRLHISNP